MRPTDQAWEYYGRTDPYFGVLTQPTYMAGEITDAAREEFFESGRRYVEFALQTVREHLDKSFKPVRALDFGCGVGRLSIPLAKICESVVGVDVSEGMLAEARKNGQQRGTLNASFVKGDDALSLVTGEFDLLNSLIVFQHIPPERGVVIFRSLLSKLREGGVGILQFTSGFSGQSSLRRRTLVRAYRALPVLWGVRNLFRGRPFAEPMMQMNAYDPGRLLSILQESGCHEVHVRFTETRTFNRPFYGLILFFRKRRLDVRAFA